MKKSVIKALCLCLVLSLCVGCSDNSNGSVTVSLSDTVSSESSIAGSSVSEASTDVTVTVGGDYTFSLTDNISDIIKNLNARNIRVIDAQYFRLYGTDDSGTIFYGQTKFDLKDTSPVVLLTADSVPNEATAAMGYTRFIFDSSKYPCDSLSLLKDWDGDIETVDKYLTDENSIRENDYIFAVFKNGSIIPARDITDKYADKASKVVECGSLDEYLKAEGLSFFNNEEINRIPTWYTGLAANPTETLSADYYAIYFALLDLASEYLDGSIDNFGVLFREAKGYIDISISTSYDNHLALKRAEKYHE